MVLCYNGRMLYENHYELYDSLQVTNTGKGTNVLSLVNPVEVPSLVPGKLYSVHVDSASFETDFSLSEGEFTLSFITKPNVGVVAQFGPYSVSYTGYSYRHQNLVGDTLELPAESGRAHFVLIRLSDGELSLMVDGQAAVLTEADTMDNPSSLVVNLLSTGGLLERVSATKGAPSLEELNGMLTAHRAFVDPMDNVVFMHDDNRDFVSPRLLAGILELPPGSEREIMLDDNESNYFKVTYDLVGDAVVSINDTPAESGFTTSEDAGSMFIYTETGCTIMNLVVTEYYSNEIMSVSAGDVSVNGSTGFRQPMHQHSDLAGTTGTTTIDLIDTVPEISGWFKAQDGAVLPGISMNAGVLTGTGLFVNGKPYSGETLYDWYFLTASGSFTGSVVIEAPVQALHTSDVSTGVEEKNNLYESFFRNPAISVTPEVTQISEEPAMIIASEWSIVASG